MAIVGQSVATSASPAISAPRYTLMQRVAAQFWLKFFGIPAATALFFAVYIYLLKHPLRQVYEMPRLPLDEWIGVQSWALVLYGTLWIYVSLPPSLMTSARAIVNYGGRIGALCGVGLLIFALWPTAVPPAHIDWAQYPGMAFLKGVDAAGNACPSLHVGTAVFSAYWLHRTADVFQYSSVWRAVNVVWCVGIAYSTLATKQHVAWDVIGGAALGLVMALITWPRQRHSVTCTSHQNPLDK